jgi:N-methylhydantoinase A/oxoprolinase/acetone carboxylase beta subunit
VRREKRMRVGIDAGGTFTDVVMADEKAGTFQYTKNPTTYYLLYNIKE